MEYKYRLKKFLKVFLKKSFQVVSVIPKPVMSS